jgi:hypothetical protein
MAAKYVPKVNDPVFMDGNSFIRYMVTKVDEGKQVADVKTVSGVSFLYRDVSWSKLFEFDESDNAVEEQ